MLPEDDDIDSDVDAELEDADDDELTPVVSVDDSGEEDDDEFEPEEGDESDADDEEQDEVVSAVEDDEDDDPAADEPSAGATKKRVRKMSEKKSMSDHVREEIDRRQKTGESLRGVDIVNALAKHKIKVGPAQVSQLLKKAGVSQKARGPRKAKLAAEAGERSRSAESVRKGVIKHRPASTVAGLPVAHLKAAKDFIAACGDSYEEAARILELHEKLHDVL
jgi:hypothetical protein